MATYTLTTDTLISALMPSGGGSLASGDTIQLAGHSLIVDADAVDYPVTIANSRADANLELRDLGRIKLNASLPANVHPWIDPAHPLPVSSEPGIDGDPYRTNLTANARAEIQLGNSSLGGGAANLPTETRDGGFWARVVESPNETTLVFDTELPLHHGDMMVYAGAYGSASTTATVDSCEGNIVVFSAALQNRTLGGIWYMLAGGVAIHHDAVVSAFTAPFCGGTILQIGGQFLILSANEKQYSCVATRILRSSIYHLGIGNFHFRDYGGLRVSDSNTNGSRYSISHICCNRLTWSTATTPGNVFDIRDGTICANEHPDVTFAAACCFSDIEFAANSISPRNPTTCLRLHDCTMRGVEIGDAVVEQAGTITRQLSGAWLHTPATAADVTWRFTDRAVSPGVTLRLRCEWMREGASATRASVAVTNAATWWPQLWPLGADALASVEFTGGTADWRQQLLTWRNTSTEAAQVRVWECVTGTVAGGYLKVEEVKGGAL